MSPVFAGILRHVLTAVGGGLVASGTVSSSELEAVIGALITIAGVIASIVAKQAPKPQP